MTAHDTTLDRLDWTDIGLQLDAEGYALLPGLLGTDVARNLAQNLTGQAAAPGIRRSAIRNP